MNKLIIYTDGGSRSNPGPAASAYVIKSEAGEVLEKGGEFLGIATNNEAEYQGVIFALKSLVENNASLLPAEIELRADSLLIVKQLRGEYKIKESRLQELHKRVKELEKVSGEVVYTHIPRSQNSMADQLVNEILDKEPL